MNWNPFKKKGEDKQEPDLLNLNLVDLKPGYVLDYDLKTWEVTAQHLYDYEGDKVEEWELTCSDDVVYLDGEDDDGFTWILTQKISLSEVDDDLKTYLDENEEPPEQIICDGVTYEAKSSSTGKFHKNRSGSGDDFIVWDYLDVTERKVLVIEQWGDDDYETSIGKVVEEYEFSNILPSE